MVRQQHEAVHVVCSAKDEQLAIASAYWLAADQWAGDFKRRL